MSDRTDAAAHVEGTDPHARLEAEQLRSMELFSEFAAAAFDEPTSCSGWRRREMLAHLAASEDSNEVLVRWGASAGKG